MLDHVTEAAFINSTWCHNEAGGHRQVPVDAHTLGDVGATRLDDVGETPNRDTAPGWFGCGEEVPVLHHLAVDAVRDVVGRQGEAIDMQPHVTFLQRTQPAVVHSSVAQIISLNLEVHIQPSRCRQLAR